mmetsp:Transcript_11061/g.17706  ORF Transcript_11061/g.17706 Transcript_11061/m.17706 type:complete len:246 (+) Transcript_11061:166-903(+)
MTMEDNTRMQTALLDYLDVPKVALAYGYSMGAMQSLHLAALHPERVERVAAVAGGVRAGDTNKVFLESLRHTIMCARGWDPNTQWYGGVGEDRVATLKAFARIYAGWGLSSRFYEEKEYLNLGYKNLEDFCVNGYEKGFASCDINDLLAQVNTWRNADLANADASFEGCIVKALQSITAKVLWMPVTTDTYFLADSIQKECALLRQGDFQPIPTNWGHRGGDPWREGQEKQLQQVQMAVKNLLDE